MKALEVKDLFIKYLMEYLEPLGFKYKKKRSTEYDIERVRDDGNVDQIGVRYLIF